MPRYDPAHPAAPDRPSAPLLRDAALRRVGRARTRLIAAAAGLSAALVALVADTAPGKTYRRTTAAVPAATARSRAPRTARAATRMPPLATPGQLGLATGPGPGAAGPAAASSARPATGSAASTVTGSAPSAPPPSAANTAGAPQQQAAPPAPVVSGGS